MPYENPFVSYSRFVLRMITGNVSLFGAQMHSNNILLIENSRFRAISSVSEEMGQQVSCNRPDPTEIGVKFDYYGILIMYY